MTELVDLQEFARLLKVTEKAVRDWIKSGMPVEKHGSQGGGEERDKTLLSLRACVAWYFETNYERFELDRQRAQLAESQRKKLDFENAKRAGELIEVKVWVEELEKFFGESRAFVLAWASKLAPRLDGDINQRKDRIEAAAHELLRRFAAYRPGYSTANGEGTAGEGAEGLGTAEQADAKRVGRSVSKAVKGKQRRTRRVAN